jgi:predicted TIM-barrel fold metal-dependent hydrolase
MVTRVVDIHPHIISTDTQQYPRDPLGGNQSTWSSERPTNTAQLLAAMDEAGVAKAAIVQASTCYGFDNSYVADAVAAHPDRFTGVFSVDMLSPETAPERIRHWVGRKLTGLRLFTAGSTMQGQADWLADPRTFAGWDTATELGIPVCVQMRAAGLPLLQVLLDRYPTTTIIIDHFLNLPLEDGAPYANIDALLGLAKHPNIYLKYTPVIVNAAKKGKATPETFFPRVLAEFGAKRIAWGSNFPANAGTLASLLTQCKEAISFASPEDQEWIFHRTSEQLYPALKP